MSELKKEIMKNDIHYTLVGDYYFPTCTLRDPEPSPGRWADLYEQYLREEHPSEYTRLMWSNQLNRLLRSVQTECSKKLQVLIQQFAKAEGINEQLKASDQLEWVRRMNSIRNQAEEIILNEMIFA